jgi:hypothetical protein
VLLAHLLCPICNMRRFMFFSNHRADLAAAFSL